MAENTERRSFTPKQELFIDWYVKLLNGVQAAKRAGYAGSYMTLDKAARDNLEKPRIKAEVDRRIKAGIVSADVLLNRISDQAIVDVSPFTREDGKLDMQKLADAGLGHLVKGIEPTSNGVKITLVDPQTAQKMLGRYHKVLGANVEIDQSTTIQADAAQLVGLAQQIAAAAATVQDTQPDDSDDG